MNSCRQKPHADIARLNAVADHPKLGIIAGAGRLPALVDAGARAAGYEPVTIAIEGQGGPTNAFATIPFGKVGKLFSTLESQGCSEVVFCGGVGRPNLSTLKMDRVGLSLLPKIAPKLASGDNSLLTTITEAFEARGFRVRGVKEIVTHLRATVGPITARIPAQSDLDDAELAIGLLHDLSRHDVGQACVVQDGRILAIEAAEGTDNMLKRVSMLTNAQRGGTDTGGILVKVPKSNQDRRIDLPAIGPETVRAATAAKLGGIVIEEKGALLVDRDEMVALADAADLFIFGRSSDTGP